MPDAWPWDQPPNCGVFTEKSILFEGAPILYVSHDLEDHGWQFLGWDDAEVENAALVSLAEISKVDPSVLEVAHIPPGWHAWRRSREEPWTTEPNPHAQDENE